MNRNNALPGSYTQKLAVLYQGYSQGVGLWEFSSTSNEVRPKLIWQSANWDWQCMQIVTAEVRNIGRPDICALYNYGNGDIGLWLLPNFDTTEQPQLLWRSGAGKWDWSRSKFLAADVYGNGTIQLCAWSDFGNGDIGLWVFAAKGALVEPVLLWRSEQNHWDWQRCSVMSADLRGVGKAELCVLYNYGDDDAGLWVFPFDATPMQPILVWRSGVGNWAWQRTKLVGADIRGIGNPALCVLSDFGQQDSGLWVFQPDGAKVQPSLVWRSGQGNWAWECSRMFAANVRNTGRLELCIFYDYGTDDAGLWVFPYDGSSPVRSLAWRSGAGNWALQCMK